MYNKLHPFKAGFLSLGTMNILGSKLLCLGAYCVSRDAVSISGFYP